MNTPSETDDADQSICFVCRREIKDHAWFARFVVAGQRVVFCRPLCVEKFFQIRDQFEANEAATFHPLGN